MSIKKRVLSGAGFTLIELLVVIAIIGILAAVVLASVGSARTKGAEASVKTQMANMRSAAELYAANNTTSPNSYAGVCTADSSAANPGVNTMINSAALAIADTTVVIYDDSLDSHGIQVAGTLVCADGAAGWVAQAPLSTGNGYWCADSSGSSKAETDVLPADVITCA